MATTQIRIGPADQGRIMSLDEFREADEEDGYRYELAGGVLEVTEVPNTPHRRVVSNLYRAIARYDAQHPGVIESFGGGAEFRLWIQAMGSGRNPDLGVVLEGTSPDARGRTQPALAAEVVSAGSRTRDYQTKRSEYLAFGLREYWIVDPFERQVILLLRDGVTWSERVLQGDQPIDSTVLPGLDCRLSDLWIGVALEPAEDDNGASL
jgi:Uma2 family endonuclease